MATTTTKRTAKKAAPKATAKKAPAKRTPAKATESGGKRNHCPNCGYEFSKPKYRCSSEQACDARRGDLTATQRKGLARLS